MKRRAKKPVVEWSSFASFISRIEVADTGRSLAVIVQPSGDRWQVLAVETVAKPESAEEVLDDHGHKFVGMYAAPPEAFAAAESYLRAWRKRHKAARVETCDCAELQTS